MTNYNIKALVALISSATILVGCGTVNKSLAEPSTALTLNGQKSELYQNGDVLIQDSIAKANLAINAVGPHNIRIFIPASGNRSDGEFSHAPIFDRQDPISREIALKVLSGSGVRLSVHSNVKGRCEAEIEDGIPHLILNTSYGRYDSDVKKETYGPSISGDDFDIAGEVDSGSQSTMSRFEVSAELISCGELDVIYANSAEVKVTRRTDDKGFVLFSKVLGVSWTDSDLENPGLDASRVRAMKVFLAGFLEKGIWKVGPHFQTRIRQRQAILSPVQSNQNTPEKWESNSYGATHHGTYKVNNTWPTTNLHSYSRKEPAKPSIKNQNRIVNLGQNAYYPNNTTIRTTTQSNVNASVPIPRLARNSSKMKQLSHGSEIDEVISTARRYTSAPKSKYFPRSERKSFHCKFQYSGLKCRLTFSMPRRGNTGDYSYYLTMAAEEAGGKNIKSSCKERRSKVTCSLRGDMDNFSSFKFKRALYG